MKSWLSGFARLITNRISLQGAVAEFLRLESAGGIVLVGTALIALLLVNSPLTGYYFALLETPLSIHVGHFGLAKPLLLWINDGLMAVFSFLSASS